ncbi:hypothetical protein E3O60_15810 [Cryobacterium sp. TMB1-7]|nr:hypothetical protein E3O60_15810 [Cryobacterium sp. TMB1-7]
MRGLARPSRAIWDIVHPAFTVFNPERETFANVWSPFHADFPTFHEHTADVLAKYRTSTSFRPQPDMPTNVFDISSVPWALDTRQIICHSSAGEESPTSRIPWVSKHSRFETAQLTRKTALSPTSGRDNGRFRSFERSLKPASYQPREMARSAPTWAEYAMRPLLVSFTKVEVREQVAMAAAPKPITAATSPAIGAAAAPTQISRRAAVTAPTPVVPSPVAAMILLVLQLFAPNLRSK